jgi:uncharacterized membrane protein affecting hemolysin expression
MRFYTELNKNVSILSDLKVNVEEFGTVTTIDRITINVHVTENYKSLYQPRDVKVILNILIIISIIIVLTILLSPK